jgi:Ca2+-binding RTX toxin-like protein
LVIDLNYQPNLDANRDTVLTNADGVVEIPVEALLHNDSGNSNTGFDSVTVGTSGTVSVSNGIVSFVPAAQTTGTFTNVVEDAADSSANALNNSLETAQDFSDRSLFGVVNSANAGLIADDAIPTARFQGTLNASNSTSRDQDWVRLYLNAGERLILDIDQGVGGASNVDTMMTLRDSSGNQLAFNDDASTTQGGLGSTSGLDSYIEYTAASDGYYYVSVTSYAEGDSGDYELWMSIDPSNGPQQNNFEYTISDGVLNNSTVADVSLIAGSTIQGSADDEVLVGGSGADTLIGAGGDDALVGNAGDDILQGGDGDDLLIGGAGEDQLSGGLGADIFNWSLADAGAAGAPVLDTISDFDTAAFNVGGDAINLKDLLIDDSGEDLTSYLQFERVDLGNGDFDTVLHVSSTGAFDGGTVSSGAEQSILLQGVDLLGTSTDQQALIQDLIATGKLITD